MHRQYENVNLAGERLRRSGSRKRRAALALAASGILASAASAATTDTYANQPVVSDSGIHSTAGSPNLTISTGTYAVGDVIKFTGTTSGTNPFGTGANTYYVVAVSGNTIEVSTTPGGTPINAVNTTTASAASQGQDWFTASNWTNGQIPNSDSTIASFSSTAGGVPDYVVNGNATLYGLTFNGNVGSDLNLVSGANGTGLYSLTFATNDGTTPTITSTGTTRLISLGTTGSGTGNLKLAIAGTQGLNFDAPPGGAITGIGITATSANPAKEIRIANVDWSGFSGGLVVERGIVHLMASNQLPAQTMTVGDATTVTNNLLAGLNLGGFNASVDGLNGNSLGRIYGTGTLTIGTNNGSGNFGGVIGADFGAATYATNLTKAGTGTETISGLITGTGTLTVSGGTLQFAGTGMLNPGTITLGAIASGAVLDLGGTSQTIAAFSGTSAGQIQNDSGSGVSTLTITGANPGTFAGVIADNDGTRTGGAVALTLNSTGTLTLTGANTFTGGVTIQAGTLNANGPTFSDTLGGVAVTLGDNSVNGNAALMLDGFNTYPENITVAASAAGGTRTITANGSNNAGQVVKTTGAWTLGSDLTVNVTNNSPLRFQGSIGGTGNLTFNAQGTGPADLRGPINNVGTVANAGTGTGGLIFNATGPGTLGANVTGLVQNSSTGNTTIGSANPNFGGAVAVNLGGLILTNAAALNAANVVSVASGATLDIQNVNQTIAGLNDVTGAGGGTVTDSTATAVHTLTLAGSGVYSFGGTITAGTPANMALTTSGNGTYILTGPSLFTGQTTINTGTLQVDGSLANTPVNVAKNGTLAGKGTINNLGTNAVAVSGAIAPGNATTIATLTTGPQAWMGGGSYTWKLGNATGSPGAGWDQVIMSGFTLDSSTASTPFTITVRPLNGGPVANLNGTSPYTWIIAHSGDGNFANLSANTLAQNFVLNTSALNTPGMTGGSFSLSGMPDPGSGSDLAIVYTPAPEPTSLALLGLGAGALLVRRRRRSARADRSAV